MNLASTKKALAARPRFRALLRLPRRRDEPVVSGPGSTTTTPVEQPKLPEEGYHFTADITDKALSFIQRREGRRAGQAVLPLLLPRRRATRRTTRRRSGPTGTRASSTWATRPTASSFSSDQKKWDPPRSRRALPDQPLHRRDRPGRARTGPTLDTVRPWDSLDDDEQAPVLADGRGLRRLPQPRRPRDRTAARLPRAERPARQHDDRPRVRQRRVGRGRPQRLGQREQVLQRPAGHDRGEPQVSSTSWARPQTYNHYPTGWAWAFNTPFKMWKRYSNYEGGTADPMIVSWPAGITDAGDPHAVHPCGRHRAHDLRAARSRAARDVVKGYTQHPLEGESASRRPSTTPTRKRASRRSSTRCSAPARSGMTAGRPPSVTAGARRLGRLRQPALGALRHREPTRASATTSPQSTRRSCRS